METTNNPHRPTGGTRYLPGSIAELEELFSTNHLEIALPGDALATLSRADDGGYRFTWETTHYHEEQSHPSQTVPSCEALLLLLLDILFSRQYPRQDGESHECL